MNQNQVQAIQPKPASLGFIDYLKRRSGPLGLTLPRWFLILSFVGSQVSATREQGRSVPVIIFALVVSVIIGVVFFFSIYDIKGRYDLNPSLKEPTILTKLFKLVIYTTIILGILFFSV